MDHCSNKLRAHTQTCYPSNSNGADTQAVNRLVLNSITTLQLQNLHGSRQAFFSAHPFSGRPLFQVSMKACLCGFFWPRDFTEVWGLGSEWHSAILTGYFNIYSYIQTTTEPLVFLVYSYKTDDRAPRPCSQENKSCNTPETYFLMLYFFSRELQCCLRVYSTAFDKAPLVQQGFIVKLQ